MGALLRNLHWIIILASIALTVKDYFELEEGAQAKKAEIAKSEEDLAKNEKIKKGIKKYLSNIDEEKAKIERVAQEIEKTQQLLPSDISDTENIGLLRKMSEEINMKEVSISPDQDDNRGFYIARKYKFKAKATYLQFLVIFEKIAESTRILNVGELEFKKLDQPQRSKFQLIDGTFFLEAYKYNMGYKEDRGLEVIEKKVMEAKKLDPPAKKKGKKSKVQDSEG